LQRYARVKDGARVSWSGRMTSAECLSWEHRYVVSDALGTAPTEGYEQLKDGAMSFEAGASHEIKRDHENTE
jgi:hypothetical protein